MRVGVFFPSLKQMYLCISDLYPHSTGENEMILPFFFVVVAPEIG